MITRARSCIWLFAAAVLVPAASSMAAPIGAPVARADTRTAPFDAPVGALDEVDPTSPRAVVVAVLERHARSELSDDEAVRALVALGPSLVQGALDLFAVEGVSTAPRAPTAAERELCLSAVGEVPHGALARACSEIVRRNAVSEGQRRAALELLAAHGTHDDVALVLDLARDGDGRTTRRQVLDALVETLSAMIRRDVATLQRLELRWPTVAGDLERACLRAAGSSGRAEALGFVSRRIDALAPDQDPAVLLAEVGRLAACAHGHAPEGLLDHVRRFLSHEERSVRESAAIACAHLRDDGAVPHLIDNLAAGDASAAWALQRITGRTGAMSVERWREWLAAENHWFAEQFAVELERLENDDPTLVCEGIRALERRTLFRERRARALAPLIDHPLAGVRDSATVVLIGLGNWSVLPELVELLDSEDVERALAARRVLETTTGWDHATSDAWRRALASLARS